MSEELKPCPFCGGEARIIERDPIYWVTCDGLTCNICAKTLPYSSREKAIEAWNTRLEHTTTRHGKFKTKYGTKVPLCECCDYSIGDKRYRYCPNCGAKIISGNDNDVSTSAKVVE